MSTGRESLLADIRANPDDDAPRLLFAAPGEQSC